MSGEKITINRTRVGFLTLACWAASLAILLFAPKEDGWRLQDAWYLWLSGFVRVGLLMGAFWLALPTRHRKAAWANVSPTTFIGLILAVILLPRFPRIIVPILIVVVIIGYVLRPREKGRPKDRPTSSS